MTGARARRKGVHHPVVEQHQADGVALSLDEIGERGEEQTPVAQLGDGARAVAHRRADIQQEVTLEVRLLLEPLHVEALGSRGQLPVDADRVIPWQVGPVLAKLDAEPFERTAVQPDQDTLNDGPSHQLQRPQPPE